MVLLLFRLDCSITASTPATGQTTSGDSGALPVWQKVRPPPLFWYSLVLSTSWCATVITWTSGYSHLFNIGRTLHQSQFQALLDVSSTVKCNVQLLSLVLWYSHNASTTEGLLLKLFDCLRYYSMEVLAISTSTIHWRSGSMSLKCSLRIKCHCRFVLNSLARWSHCSTI